MPRPRTWRSGARSARGLNPALKRLGQRLKRLRNLCELTQEELADAARLDAKHVQDVEGGRTNPTFATLLALSRALKVPLTELLEGV